MNDLCTSSAPSEMRKLRAVRYIFSNGRSAEYPRAPWT